MFCQKCQVPINHNGKFCISCGAPVDNKQEVEIDNSAHIKKVENEQASSTEILHIEEPSSPDVVNDVQVEATVTVMEQLQAEAAPALEYSLAAVPVNAFKALNKLQWGLWIAFGSVVAILLAITAFFGLHQSDKHIEVLPAQGAQTAISQAIEAIYLSADNFIIYPNRQHHIEFSTYPENADTTDLIWESSNPDIKINPSGYIISTSPESSGIITIKNASGTVQVEATVEVTTTTDAFYATLDQINMADNNSLPILDYNKEQFTVGTFRNEEDYTKTTALFTLINKEIDSYLVSQKEFINKETNNLVQVDTYSDRESNDIRKIVAIEYLPNDSLDITDFYFHNGEFVFYFNRVENYYRPVAAQQDFVGVRAFYWKDALHRYRDIVRAGDGYEKTDYTYYNELDWKVYAYKIIDIDDVNKEKSNYEKPGENEQLTEGNRKAYIVNEQLLLNKAYNMYNAVVTSPDIMTVSGYVADPSSSNPVSNVVVKMFSDKYKLLVGETRTDNDGYYQFNVPMNQGNYYVFVSEDKYVNTTIHDIDSNQSISTIPLETIYLFTPSNVPYNIYVNLINAITGLNIYDQLINESYNQYGDEQEYDYEDTTYTTYYEPIWATVYVRSGINNRKGTVSHTVTANLRDTYGANLQLLPGNYTLEVTLNGYESNFFTVSTLTDGMEVRSNIVPEIENDEVRIVLTWSHTPSDLDSHLFFPNGSHIAYYEPSVNNSFLDVDDTSGYGPETITIRNLSNGTYKYYVADYTNLAGGNYHSVEMSNSFARVDVYTKNGSQSFTIPRNESAVLWQVFSISNGQIVPVQRVFNNVEDYNWWSSNK